VGASEDVRAPMRQRGFALARRRARQLHGVRLALEVLGLVVRFGTLTRLVRTTRGRRPRTRRRSAASNLSSSKPRAPSPVGTRITRQGTTGPSRFTSPERYSMRHNAN
jgi:hypothetical protein